METVANEFVFNVHGWQLDIPVPHYDGGNDGIPASTSFDGLS